MRRGFSHSTYAAFALREAIVFTFVERPGIFLKLDLCAVAAAFNFSRFAFSSSRMEARAPFTTAERLSAEMVSAASRNARAKAFVPRSARPALSSHELNFQMGQAAYLLDSAELQSNFDCKTLQLGSVILTPVSIQMRERAGRANHPPCGSQ
jgi:hypothetical protein